MKTPHAILFDLDGVLVRSHEAWFQLMRDASRFFGGKEVTRKAFEPVFGQGPEADIAMFGLNCSVDQLNAYFFEHFERYGEDVWVDPEATALLDALDRANLRHVIVTNTMTPLAQNILKQAGLFDRFDHVFGADQVLHGKPDPAILFLALKRLGLKSGQAWMIGDSRFDLEAARAAHVFFVGYGGLEGDRKIEHLRELPALLDAHGR
ncbi:MAG: HAD family hydrolase [Myxococcales bacterium]|jgi:phosphoglycolate phosphatase/AHBA synthesis associated protein|nr:HAD family hydrolase [Myxococcales bacterium]